MGWMVIILLIACGYGVATYAMTYFDEDDGDDEED